jgi:hypothetical protein
MSNPSEPLGLSHRVAPGSSGARRPNPMSSRDATASNWRTWPNRNARRNVPNVDGAGTPVKTLGSAPARSMSKSAIESAPAHIPATSAVTFPPAPEPGPPGSVRC